MENHTSSDVRGQKPQTKKRWFSPAPEMKHTLTTCSGKYGMILLKKSRIYSRLAHLNGLENIQTILLREEGYYDYKKQY